MEKNSTNKTDRFKIHPGRSVMIKEACLNRLTACPFVAKKIVLGKINTLS